MATTLHDVCRETGFSTATVSRVLNNSPLVTPETRERVLKAMEKLDYHPSLAARALSIQRTETIGIHLPDIGPGFYTKILQGAESVAFDKHYHLMTAISHGVRDAQQQIIRLIRERRVDTLIVVNLDLPGPFLAEVNCHGLPIISMDTPAVEHGIPSVSIDNHKGGYDLMQHMLGHGYRDILIFAGPKISYDSRGRLEGCRASARDAGIAIPADNIVTGDFRIESGAALMDNILKSGRKRPEAIVSLNDAMAIGALGVMRGRGLKTPDDLAIAGFDDSDAASIIGLTTVGIPHYQMGQEAARLALSSLEEASHPPQHIIVSTQLTVRHSCGC